MVWRALLFGVVLLATAQRGAQAVVATNALFSDNMVLQTSAGLLGSPPPTTFHGTADPGEAVTLKGSGGFPGSPYTATTDSTGKWSIALKPDSTVATVVGSSYTLILTGSKGGSPIVAKDVVFGDVYLCTGQSNMEKTVSYSFNGTAEIAAAVPGTPGGPPTMRLFQRQTVSCPGNRGPKGGPMADICGPNGAHWGTPSRALNGSCIFEGSSGKSCLNPIRQWTPVSPKVVGDFSAICYLTARDVSRLHTGSRPIGLIESDWGGTPVQAWTPPAGLEACGLPLHNCTTEPNGNCTDYPSKLFNHMVQPFVGFGLRAILWYQGEANSDEGFPMSRPQYACAFGQMIEGWRKAWNSPSLPFGFVQLSSWTGNWGFDQMPCVANYCPVISRIRLAQADVVGQGGPPSASERGAPLPGAPSFPLSDTFMAVAYDQGDNQQHGVHSRFKSEPAHRLALQLIHTAFGTSTPYSGPLPLSAHHATSTTLAALAGSKQGAISVRVVVSHSSMLRLNDTHTCNEQFEKKCCAAGASGFGARICTAAVPTGCAIAADGKTVFDANVTIDSPTSILVTAAATTVSTVASFVEFGVTDFPQCSVVNEIGIALGPFILPVK